MNTIIKSPFYIREFLGIISRQQRENLSTELKAKGETGIQKNDKLKFVSTFVMIIALYKLLYLESSITTKNSLHCGEIISLNSHIKRKRKKMHEYPSTQHQLINCTIQMKTLNKGPWECGYKEPHNQKICPFAQLVLYNQVWKGSRELCNYLYFSVNFIARLSFELPL